MKNQSSEEPNIQNTDHELKVSSSSKNQNSTVSYQSSLKQQEEINFEKLNQEKSIVREKREQLILDENQDEDYMSKQLQKEVKTLLQSTLPWTTAQIQIYINSLQKCREDFDKKGTITKKINELIHHEINKEYLFYRTTYEIRKLHYKMLKQHKSIEKIIENGLEWYKTSNKIKKQPKANNPHNKIVCFNFQKQRVEYISASALKSTYEKKRELIADENDFFEKGPGVKCIVGIPVRIMNKKVKTNSKKIDPEEAQEEPESNQNQN